MSTTKEQRRYALASAVGSMLVTLPQIKYGPLVSVIRKRAVPIRETAPLWRISLTSPPRLRIVKPFLG